jgi:hypothetical protein
MYGFVFLGRGAWNMVNVFACTRDWWLAVRERRPLFGRVLTAAAVAMTVGCVWQFMAFVRIEKATYSSEAHEIAQYIEQNLSCDDVRAKAGTTTSDVRQRGDREYHVTIRWACGDTRIVVRDSDDRIGVAVSTRPDCCPEAAPASLTAPTAPAAPAA